MTANEVLQNLVRSGALIQDVQTNLLLLPIFAELIIPPPRECLPAVEVLYWVDAGAEDMHHTHFRPYAHALVLHDRDLILTDSTGHASVYVAPIEEWPLVDIGKLQRQLADARLLAENDLRTFECFVRDCRPR